jgi:hypothetical protein
MSQNKVLDYFNVGQTKHRSSQTAYLCIRGSSKVLLLEVRQNIHARWKCRWAEAAMMSIKVF